MNIRRFILEETARYFAEAPIVQLHLDTGLVAHKVKSKHKVERQRVKVLSRFGLGIGRNKGIASLQAREGGRHLLALWEMGLKNYFSSGLG